jgi:sulfite reductase (NADPH) hemoprotein beta-component
MADLPKNYTNTIKNIIMELHKKSPVEYIKENSKQLRGTINDGLLDDITGSISDADVQVIKFHGMYQQDDRDRRNERAQKKLERLYSFMVRLRLPGGDITAAQWIALHHIAGKYSTGVIKATTRQTVQLHGIIKSDIKPTLKEFNKEGLDSIATCGDINRNVAVSSNPAFSPIHKEVYGYAKKISELLMPVSKAWYEIWIDDEKQPLPIEEDKLYQNKFLPRKFKIGIAIPPNNDVDVLTNDLGLIAIEKDGNLAGFNIAIGGGLSQTHGNNSTYPRLASVIGYVAGEENTMKAIYEVLTIQRDYGNREDRKLARLKYTVDKYGIDWFKKEIENRAKITIEEAVPYKFESRKDLFGWTKGGNEEWYYTVFTENGRITNEHGIDTMNALYEIAKLNISGFRFTSNQNVIITHINQKNKQQINSILKKHGVADYTENIASELRKNSMACVAFNTCPLALAEAQRYLPILITKMESLIKKYELENEPIITRMTGCPNGCGRSPAAEIGLIGTAYGKYNLHLGGDYEGTRLNFKLGENQNEEQILGTLDLIFKKYTLERLQNEKFGDFTYRMKEKLQEWVKS